MALPADHNIYLVGFMASGKTTVGRELAPMLGREFIDLDEAIEASTEKSISDIWVEAGEVGFRDIETSALEEVSRGKGFVVSLGGGGVLRPENNEFMKETGTIVYLKTELAVVAERIEADGLRTRPLVHGANAQERLSTLTRIHVGRIPLYDKIADVTVDGGAGTPREVAAAIIEKLEGVL